MQAIDNSLKRLQLDYVDLVYCHRPDANTPLEETVFAMHDMIARGKALYWGTSEWSAADIMGAWQIADKHHLHKPVVEQPEYNLFHRRRVEQEYSRLYDELGIGTTIWSPLASGLLTGKYVNGIPPDSRGSLKSMAWMGKLPINRNAIVVKLAALAQELAAPPRSWRLPGAEKPPRVSTVITGSRTAAAENMRALEVAAKLTPEVMAHNAHIFGSRTTSAVNAGGDSGADSMEMKKVSAANLRAIGYDDKRRVLVVEQSAGTWEYANVSPEVWRRFSTSSSIASFFRDTIEEDYQKRRIK
jgi:aryl-alcohol dehydrogenase-like predicted oxidoreductase